MLTPGSGVLIDVRAAGLSFAEVLTTRGLYQVHLEPPYVPGSEVAGTVQAAPEGSPFAPGDRVAAFTMVGGCAETAVAPAYLTFALPERLDFAQGASPAERSSWLASTVIRRCGPATSRIDGWRQARRAPAERGERCLTRH